MSLRLVLIGFGNVARRLSDILIQDQFTTARRGLDARVIAITTHRRGALVNPDGIDLRRAREEVRTARRFSLDNPEFATIGSLEAAGSLEYDALVELTPLNIQGRGEPALSHIRTALRRGRHVVTANKGPVAFAYGELTELAQAQHCALRFEATVMDGAPVFNLARHCLRGCQIHSLEGILNSTSNFVLSRMQEGEPLRTAVLRAQAAGIAEADPALDLEGWDGAAKISVLANALMGGSITPLQIERQSLHSIDEDRLRSKLNRARPLRYICRAWRQEGRVRASVQLEEVESDHLFASVSGAGSVLTIETDMMSPISVVQHDPTVLDTAYGVLADLLCVARETGA